MLQIKKRNLAFRGRITVKKRKKSTARTNTDNHWCGFSSLESAERRERTEGRHGCHVTALEQVGICKIFGVGDVAITFTLSK